MGTQIIAMIVFCCYLNFHDQITDRHGDQVREAIVKVYTAVSSPDSKPRR